MALLPVVGISIRELAAGTPAPGQRAQQLLLDLEKSDQARVSRHAAQGAARALEQSGEYRKRGEAKHAELSEALALEWAELGRDLTRTAAAEAEAVRAEKELLELKTKLVGVRTLLEQTAARRARAKEQLDAVQREPSAETPAKDAP